MCIQFDAIDLLWQSDSDFTANPQTVIDQSHSLASETALLLTKVLIRLQTMMKYLLLIKFVGTFDSPMIFEKISPISQSRAIHVNSTSVFNTNNNIIYLPT